MPHEGSAWTAASNPAIAWLNQNEWSRATARVNSFCAASLQDVGKFTAPSFSGTCCAPADATKRSVMEMAMARDRIVVLLFSTQIERPRSWQRTCQQRRIDVTGLSAAEVERCEAECPIGERTLPRIPTRTGRQNPLT